MINSCLTCILNNQDLLIVLVDHLLKTKKEFKNLKKQETQTIFTKIARNPKYDGYQCLAFMVYKFFDKKSTGSGVNMHANYKIKQNQRSLDLATHQLAEELHKPIIKKN